MIDLKLLTQILAWGNLCVIPLLIASLFNGLTFLFVSLLITSLSSFLYYGEFTQSPSLLWNLSRLGGLTTVILITKYMVVSLTILQLLQIVLISSFIGFIVWESERSTETTTFLILHLMWRTLCYLLGLYILTR